MTDPGTTEILDVERVRAGLAAARRIARLESLPWIPFLAASAVDQWMTRGLSWYDAAVWPVILASIVMETISTGRLDTRRLAGPRDVLITHYRGVLKLVVAAVPGSATAVVFTVAGGGMAVAGFLDDGPNRTVHILSGVVIVLGALYPLIQRSRSLSYFRNELAALPSSAPPSSDLTERARELVLSGQKTKAIKEWREATGASLAEAKAAVENFDRD